MDYPWYELLEDSSEITQGDIVKNCPVPILADVANIEAGQNMKAEIEFIDGIILTQACDLANHKVDNVILCIVTSKKEFETQLLEAGRSKKEIKKNIDGIIKGQQNAYHLINYYKSDIFSEDYYIINTFGKQYSKEKRKTAALVSAIQRTFITGFCEIFYARWVAN